MGPTRPFCWRALGTLPFGPWNATRGQDLRQLRAMSPTMTRLVDGGEGACDRDHTEGGVMAEWLQETEGKTVFEGDVLKLQKREAASGPRGKRVWDQYD